MNNHKISVIVGMSGGVDSSVAALKLKQQGFKVAGVFMKNWEEDDLQSYGNCNATKDLGDAQQVCDTLNIPLHKVNFAAEYWDKVFQIFLQEYQNGRTPNPDILCNNEIKFKLFLKYAQQLGADFIATGHYARTIKKSNKTSLLTAADHNKDQTYFLHGLQAKQLDNCMFPLGNLLKPQIRDLAKSAGFYNYNKKDSTGICFIGERKFKNFLAKYLPNTPGNIVDEHGNIVGKHSGVHYYTIGQRQGLGIGGSSNHANIPGSWYVVAKNLAINQLTVVKGQHNPKLYNDQLLATHINWINPINIQPGYTYTAKIRYRQIAQPCYIQLTDPSTAIVNFTSPQRAITPGQYVVFYDKEECLGGGIIT